MATLVGVTACLLASACVAAMPADGTRWVQATRLLVRSEPSGTAPVLEHLMRGHRVVLSQLPSPGAEWCPVQAPASFGVTAYVACRYLSEQPVAHLRAGEDGVPADRRWVTGSQLRLRAEPRADAAVLASLALNTALRLKEAAPQQGYCAVETTEGPTLAGYTACRYLGVSPLDLGALATPQRLDGSDNPDFDAVRAFAIAPSWELMAHHARRVQQARQALGEQAPRGPDEALERMKARLSGQVVASGNLPTVWPEWQRGGQPAPADGAVPLGLEGELFQGEGAHRAASFLNALPPLPAVAPSWWRSDADLAGPGESIGALANRFGAQVVWLHESLQPGSLSAGAVEPGARIDRLTLRLHSISLLSDQTLRDERQAPEHVYRDWDPTTDVNCDGWVEGFAHGQADRATSQRNGFTPVAAGRPHVLFRFWSQRPLPPGPARWTRQAFALDRAATGFVRGEWRTVDLDNDGVADLAWLQATGRGPGHMEGPPPHDDPWYRLLLANVAGRWRLLGADAFSYGCGC
jgi:hypothetical protein